MSDPEPLPAEATFATSWRTFAREQATIWVFVVPGVAGLLWVAGEGGPLFALGFSAAFGLAAWIWEAGRFRLLGAAEVHISPEAVTVRSHGGRARRVARADLVGLWLDKRWVIKGRDETVRVRDLGFRHEDWMALGATLTRWKVESDAPRPGIREGERRAGGGAAYEIHRPVLTVTAMGAFAAVCALPALASLGAYRDGSWVEDPWVTVVLALGGLGLAAYLAWGSLRVARRVSFDCDAMRVDRVLGTSWTVPYTNVVDGLGSYVDTRQGTFTIDRRNDDVFWQLLDERLAEEQLTGERWLRMVLWLQPRVLIGGLVGAVALWVGASWLGRGAGLTPDWATVAAVGAVATAGAFATLAVRLRVRHLLRHADD